MNKGKFIYSLVYLTILFSLSGCSAAIGIKACPDRSSSIELSMSMGDALADTLQSMLSMNGDSSTDGVFSAASMEKVKLAFEGGDFTDVALSSPSASSLLLSGRIKPAEEQRVLSGSNIKVANLITCTSSSLTVILSPEIISQLAAALPEESSSYLGLFMAPVFTGEAMSAEEYRELISAVYGEELARELDKSSLRITLEPPDGKKIQQASLSGTERARTSGEKASFSIPLIEFFTLSSPRTFSISW